MAASSFCQEPVKKIRYIRQSAFIDRISNLFKQSQEKGETFLHDNYILFLFHGLLKL